MNALLSIFISCSATDGKSEKDDPDSVCFFIFPPEVFFLVVSCMGWFTRKPGFVVFPSEFFLRECIMSQKKHSVLRERELK